MQRQFRTGEPKMKRGTKSVIISHKEYFTDLYGSSTSAFPSLDTAQYVRQRINPANAGLFPWLSGIAKMYETYRFRKLIFSYESSASTSTGGKILLAVDYDATDLPPDNAVKVMAMEGSVKCPSWSESYHVSTLTNLHKQKINYTNFDRNAEGDNLRQNDIGNFYAIALSQGTTNLIGDLFVDYEIELTTPQLDLGDAWYLTQAFNALDFPAATVVGNIAMIVSAVSNVRMEQELIGYINIIQKGTGVTNHPTAAIISGTGTIIIHHNAVATGGGGAIALYKCKLTPGAVVKFDTGTHTTLTEFQVLFTSIPSSVYAVIAP